MTQTTYIQFEDLTLYRWDKFKTSNDANWFIDGFDGRQTKIDNPELKKHRDIIVDEYFKYLDDPSFTNQIQNLAKIDNLRTRYVAITTALNRMWLGFSNEQMETRLSYIQALKKFGLKMPEINTIDGDKEYLERFKIAVENIRTEIDILKSTIKKDADKETRNLHKEMLVVSIGLQLSYRLNAKELLLIDWIEMCKELQERAKRN